MVCDRVLIMNRGRIVASGTTDELEAGLNKAQQQVFVVMGDCHRKEEAQRFLDALPGIERVAVVEEKNDQICFSLVAERGPDLRPAISRLFVEHRIPLLEIRSGRLTLEEIFMKIMVNESPVGKKS